ncbi:MAG: hypothetical protein J5678_03760 [Bacteroidaceae bacterium]|nr:hypothetical protein [Bacteroidaceae bacterium]
MKKFLLSIICVLTCVSGAWAGIVTNRTSAGDPVTYATYVASAGSGAKYAFMMPSDNSSTYLKWCGFRSGVANEYTLSVNHLFILENGSTTGKYKLKSYSDGKYLAGNNNFGDTPLDLTLVNRLPSDNDYHSDYSNSDLHISFDNASGNHYNNYYRDFRGGTGEYSTCIAYGPFYVVTVNCVDESNKTIRTVKYPVQDGTNFTIAPNVGGYKAKANPDVTVSGADVTVKVTYEDAFKPSANKRVIS